MAAASQKVWEDIRETLLTCKICEEPFDQQERLPRVLPCHHTFCGPCIAKLDKGGELSCPNCRQEIQVAGTFPVETTRSSLLDCTEVIETAQEAPCEGCDDGTKATSRCLDCAQALCEECRAAHKRVKTARDHVIVSLQEATRSPSLLTQKVEMCQKHSGERVKVYCLVCKTAVCSTCAITLHLHKDHEGRSMVELEDILEQVKTEIERLCVEYEDIQKSSLQPRAKMAATSLQETDASFQDAAKELQEGFGRLVTAIRDREEQAMEELRSKWKADRLTMEDQAGVTESQVNAAKTCRALGRTVSSVGLPSHIVAQRQELERAVQEARAEGEKPLLLSMRYKVNFDTSRVMDVLPHLGTIQSVPSAGQSAPAASVVTSPRQPAPTASAVTSPGQPAPTASAVTSPRQPASAVSEVTSPSQPAPAASEVTSSTIQTPEFQLEPGRCNAECTLEEDGRTLTNIPRPQSGGTGQSGLQPFAFPGTCGSVDLAQPALHYWTVRLKVSGFGERCEIGLASLQSLQTCGSGKRISAHDIQAPTIVAVRKANICRLEGRGWTQDVDTPPPPVTSDTPYTCLERKQRDRSGFFSTTLGFLYDNRQPQSPRVMVVETEGCRLLGVRRLSPSPDLRPVLKVEPPRFCNEWDVTLEMRTGPEVLDDVTGRRLQSLLGRME